MHTFGPRPVSGALAPLRPLAAGEGGARAERRGRGEVGRAAARSLWLPHLTRPSPPQGRRRGYLGSGISVHTPARLRGRKWQGAAGGGNTCLASGRNRSGLRSIRSDNAFAVSGR